MALTMTTKLTKGGQTTIPKEIRTALGIGDEARVWWRLDGDHATLSSEPPLPNTVSSHEEFWDGIELALSDVASGRTRDARELSRELSERHGLK